MMSVYFEIHTKRLHTPYRQN